MRAKLVLTSLFMMLSFLLTVGAQVPDATPIVLPTPYVGYETLSGMSGFFMTRSGLEKAVVAMETVPILQGQIADLTKLGLQKDEQLKNKNWEEFLVGSVTFVIAGLLGITIGVLIK
jgi:hypothetical protein